MVSPVMHAHPRPWRARLPLVLTGVVALLFPTLAGAQTFTATGNFSGSAVGTYTQTLTQTSGSRTVQIVYTRRGDQATRTDISTVTPTDAKGDYTLTESSMDFGASEADSSTATYTRVNPGEFTGTGTYTTASGDTGTLTAVLTRTASGTSRSELHVSASTGNTVILRVDHEGGTTAGYKILMLSPTGALTSVSLVRTSTTGAGANPTPSPTPTVTPTPTPSPTPVLIVTPVSGG
jgi:hypothetical protein